jgi:hypothetical protein
MTPLSTPQVIGVSVMLTVIIIGALELCRKFKKRPPLSPYGTHVRAVSRRVVAVDGSDWNSVRVDLECGHTVYWNMVGVNTCDCPYCTAEVEKLKKMAGEK